MLNLCISNSFGSRSCFLLLSAVEHDLSCAVRSAKIRFIIATHYVVSALSCPLSFGGEHDLELMPRYLSSIG
jgi:hypothetical protein